MLKSQIPMGGGRGGGSNPTFDAESRNAKIPNSHWGEGGGGLVTNLHKSSSNKISK